MARKGKGCKEKWVFWWIDPETGKKRKKVIFNEDEAAKFFVQLAAQGIENEHKFYDCGANK